MEHICFLCNSKMVKNENGTMQYSCDGYSLSINGITQYECLCGEIVYESSEVERAERLIELLRESDV